MNEKLENLLREWKKYNVEEGTIPSRILKKEKISISKAVQLTVGEMKVPEYENMPSEYKKEVEDILFFLENVSSTVEKKGR